MTDFTVAVEQGGRAAGDFAGGDPQPYRSLWARDVDVTIFGAWGAHEQGWQQVGRRLDWAAARFASGGTQQEILSMGSSGDLGYTVALERGQVRLAGESVAAPMLLRVTHLYRRVGREWKIIHRHADAVTDKIAPAAVLAPAAGGRAGQR
ncbi:MAG TPA: nuclear transport factor 2 family protein [Kineosporiaceae bacterium]|nr:nuclear transport factor 2 family protein [Kineosporiaceae bacterium]